MNNSKINSRVEYEEKIIIDPFYTFKKSHMDCFSSLYSLSCSSVQNFLWLVNFKIFYKKAFFSYY